MMLSDTFVQNTQYQEFTMKHRFAILIFAVSLFVATIILPVVAQENAEDGAVCDSTLATLILVAEFKYDYLSAMMMDEEMMAMMPNLNFGQYQPLMDEIVAMMMEMMEEDPMMGMTEEEMAMHDELLAKYKSMTAKDAIADYFASMNMDMMGDNMTELVSGTVSNEDPACAAARIDVEAFLLAHVLTELSTMSMSMGQ
jgi:hypothetical protein